METFVDTLEDNGLIEAKPSVDEVLARWKARADAYRYDPDKKHQYISLEEFGERLMAAVKAKLIWLF